MEDNKKKDDHKKYESRISKVYFEGDWKKDEGVTWAFFEAEDNKNLKFSKKEEIIKEPDLEEPEIFTEKPQEIVSITSLGLSSEDPRYRKVSQTVQEQVKAEPEKLIKPDKPVSEKTYPKTCEGKEKKPSASSLAAIMAQSQKEHSRNIQKNKDLTKIKGVIYDLGKDGFSFFSLMFDKDTSITDTNLKKMGQILKYDPALALKIIQIANSAYYGLSSKTFNIIKALNLLGVERAKKIVFKASSSDLFSGIRKKELFKQLWYHSLGTGVFCSIFAKNFGFNEDEFFMIGMMHDIGKVILYAGLRERYEEIIQVVKEKPILLCDAEKEYLDFDHCEVGKMALESWELPEELINSAQYHHSMDLIQNPQLLKQLAIVQASDVLCNLSKIGDTGAKRSPLLDKRTKKIIGKIETQKLKEEVQKRIKEIEVLIDI